MKTTKYTQVEKSLWDDPAFRLDLTRDERDLLLYLRTCPQHGILPGLFVSSPLVFANHLSWGENPLTDGLQAILTAFQGLRDKGRVHYDERTQTVFIHGVVEKFPPRNSQVVLGWKPAFESIPDSSVRMMWLRDAEKSVVKAQDEQKRVRGESKDNRHGTFRSIFEDEINAMVEADGFQRGSDTDYTPSTGGLPRDNLWLTNNQNTKHGSGGKYTGKRPAVNNTSRNVVNHTDSTVETGHNKTETETKTEGETRARSRDLFDTEVKVPDCVGYDRNRLPKKVQLLGDILNEYFPHVGLWQVDEWAYRLNMEFGRDLDLERLFREIGETQRGNTRKVHPGKEWGHIRSWCRNASGGKEFSKGDDQKGIDVFRSKNGRDRFMGLYVERGKTISECVDMAADDGGATPDQIRQWREDLAEYEAELKETRRDG